MTGAELFICPFDTGKKFLRNDRDVDQWSGGGGAVVTIGAVVGGDRFTKVIEQWLAAAGRFILCVADDGIQMLDRHALLGAGFLVDKIVEFCSIRVTIQQQAMGGQTIPPGATDLLIVPLDAFGE